MTDFEEMREHRLPNWGAWGRQDQDKPNSQRPGGSICVDFNPSKDWEPGWGDMDAVPEAPPIPIDHRDAENLDGYIRQLGQEHRETIRRHYYKDQRQQWERLDAAVRALLDITKANRRVVDFMGAR